jgi:hypothetical protein
MLPYPEAGKTDKETLQNLFDAYFKLRKELEYILHNLDDSNILEIDAAKIRNLKADEAYINTLIAEYIEANEIQSDVVISNTVITQNLYAARGSIAELTVDRLETSEKVRRYREGDTRRLDYIRIEGKSIDFIEAVVKAGTPSPTVQLRDRSLNPVYWTDESMISTSLEANAYPVMIYDYDEVSKLKLFYELDETTGYYVPKMVWGVGAGVDGHPEYGKGYIFKDETGMIFKYIDDLGKTSSVRIGSFVDANHRRLKSCIISKTNKNVTILEEGRAPGNESVISYVENENGITYTFPDGFTTTVKIT